LFTKKYLEKILVKNICIRVFVLITLFCVITNPKQNAIALTGSVYFVSPSGNDNNPGTLNQPWKTIRKAANSVIAGDTVYLRGGVYFESVEINRSGTSAAPISFLAYPDETPILDGNNYTIPSIAWGPLLKCNGDYIYISGLEVRYSRGIGIALSGEYNQVSDVNSHHNKENGILVYGDNSIVTNSRIWSNCMSNLNGGSNSGWSSGISAARYPNNTIIRNNIVYSNWGEGLSTYEANGTIIEGNTVYDNWSANIYISDATNIIVNGNFIYHTGSITGGSNVGIMMGDETYDPASANIQVVNNIAFGNHRNFFWWRGDQGGGMNNVQIAHNTFVNGTGDAALGEGGVIIGAGTHTNVQFENNLVNQDGSLPVIATVSQPGVQYAYNLWSKMPYAAASGPGDVIGDPMMAKVGSPFSVDWFQLTYGSPAIDNGKFLQDVRVDYFGTDRGNLPDIGAIEHFISLHELSVQIIGPAPGRVITDPVGIDCGTVCSEFFNYGTTVTLTALKAPIVDGFTQFLGWGGGTCFGTGDCVITLTEAITVTAEFEEVIYFPIFHLYLPIMP